MRLALLHAIGGGHPSGKLRKDLPEHALAAVAVDDALVVDEIGRRCRQRARRHALAARALFHLAEETVERHAVVARRAAARGGRGSSGG